ncbi:MAG: calcium:sodium antiporter [Gammaproteobacteria bacterium TMED222]|nr:MAG: calcium:sodium antiporter [Gammaproteobacteria bacterium TMED222]
MELFQSIWQPLVFLLLSMAILVWGADKFVNYSSLLSKKLGINELTIGLTVVALGTSAPEIFVGISSVLNESESIAMGAIVGSNISNIALIFGVACFGASMKAKKTPSSQLIPVILSSGMLGIALYDLYISFLESFIILSILIYFMYITFKNKSLDSLEEERDFIGTSNLLICVYLFIGLISLILGSRYAVINAEKIAYILNISELIIGLTIVAIGTSLPELAATVAAVLKKKTDMVVGNVIGSNVLNIILVVPIIGFFSNTQFEASIFNRDYIIMIFATFIFLLIVKFQTSSRVSTSAIKAIGLLLLVGYGLYISLLANLI